MNYLSLVEGIVIVLLIAHLLIKSKRKRYTLVETRVTKNRVGYFEFPDNYFLYFTNNKGKRTGIEITQYQYDHIKQNDLIPILYEN